MSAAPDSGLSSVPGTQRLPIAAMALIVGMGTIAQTYAVSHGVELSRGAAQLWYVCFSYSVAWWVEIDRKARGISAPFEYSAFMFFVWPLLAPYYLFKSRRWRGLVLAAGLILFSSVPDIATISIYYFAMAKKQAAPAAMLRGDYSAPQREH